VPLHTDPKRALAFAARSSQSRRRASCIAATTASASPPATRNV